MGGLRGGERFVRLDVWGRGGRESGRDGGCERRREEGAREGREQHGRKRTRVRKGAGSASERPRARDRARACLARISLMTAGSECGWPSTLEMTGMRGADIDVAASASFSFPTAGDM